MGSLWHGKWYVEDGLLICESGPDKKYGYLATRDYYDDFDLTVESNRKQTETPAYSSVPLSKRMLK